MSWFERWRRPAEPPNDPALRAAEDALLQRARALPREIEPGRDLWLGIRNRIEAPAPVHTGWRAGRRVPVWAAAAVAGLLLVVGIGSGVWFASGPPSLDDPAVVRALAASLRDRDGVAELRSQLLALLDERRGQLPPELVTTLERNLLEIDRAIAEIHLALEAHPTSPALQFLLAEAYRSEAEMLEQLEWWTGGLGAEESS
jgi:hypothetical protein